MSEITAKELREVTNGTPQGASDSNAGFGVPPTHADAYLFICKKPGLTAVFASVERSGSESWPWDEWHSVVRARLVEDGAREQIWPMTPNA